VPAKYLHESIVHNPTKFFSKLQIKLHGFWNDSGRWRVLPL